MCFMHLLDRLMCVFVSVAALLFLTILFVLSFLLLVLSLHSVFYLDITTVISTILLFSGGFLLVGYNHGYLYDITIAIFVI